MKIIALITAIIPFLEKLFSKLFPSKEEKLEQALKELPEKLQEVQDALNKTKSEKDPSFISRLINRS